MGQEDYAPKSERFIMPPVALTGWLGRNHLSTPSKTDTASGVAAHKRLVTMASHHTVTKRIHRNNRAHGRISYILSHGLSGTLMGCEPISYNILVYQPMRWCPLKNIEPGWGMTKLWASLQNSLMSLFGSAICGKNTARRGSRSALVLFICIDLELCPYYSVLS